MDFAEKKKNQFSLYSKVVLKKSDRLIKNKKKWQGKGKLSGHGLPSLNGWFFLLSLLFFFFQTDDWFFFQIYNWEQKKTVIELIWSIEFILRYFIQFVLTDDFLNLDYGSNQTKRRVDICCTESYAKRRRSGM